MKSIQTKYWFIYLWTGYISGLNGGQHEALSGFFATGEVPLIALDTDRKPTLDEFSTMPSGKYQALALLKLLKKLKWEFVAVVLSEQVHLNHFLL